MKHVVLLLLLLVGSLGLRAQRRQPPPEITAREYWSQEKHLDAVDQVGQKNKDAIEAINLRLEGDEDFVKGGAWLLGLLISVGLISLHVRKNA